MPPADARSLLDVLEQVTDPRGRQGQRHPHTAMLAAVVCAVLCGARGLRPIAQWVRSQTPDTWHWLGFRRKPPCANCFSGFLRAICVEEFERAIRQWTAQLTQDTLDDESLAAISIDGKTLCGTLQPHQRAIHLLSAFDHQTGCVLSQREVDHKTNEAKTALPLLKTLVLKGHVIVGDAMFCQREVCQEILDSDGDYLFVVKDNQPTLLREIASAFADTKAFSPLGAARVRALL